MSGTVAGDERAFELRSRCMAWAAGVLVRHCRLHLLRGADGSHAASGAVCSLMVDIRRRLASRAGSSPAARTTGRGRNGCTGGPAR